MRIKLKIIFVLFILFSCKTTINQNEYNESLYEGYEKIGVLDESNPEMIWYYQTLIKIKNDSVFIDQYPIMIYDKDTLFSSSDGGFYYFKGIISKKEEKIFTKLISCDYCGIRVKKKSDGTFEIVMREKNFEIKIVSDGLFVDNQLFKKIKNRTLRAENL